MKSLPERGSGVCVKTGRDISIQTNFTHPYPPTTHLYIKNDMSVLNYTKMSKVKPPLQKPTIQ